MSGIDWKRARSILERVLDAPEAEQDERLAAECGDDRELLAQLRELLQQDREETDFLRTVAMPVEPVPEADAGKRIGPWQLEHILGSGGMGTVWFARRVDGAYDQGVALKVARSGHATANLLTRLERERAFLARLEHPGIARLIDGGSTEDGAPYFALEFVDGVQIDRFADGQRLSLRERIGLFVRVLEAVDYAHNQGLVHRDLKPGNLLVTADGQPKLLDFGIAKLIDNEEEVATLTLTGERLMTPRYASPEQVRAEPVTAAADVYALGVLLYELLTGFWPYHRAGASMVELQLAICNDLPLPASRAIDTVALADTQPATETADVTEITTRRSTTAAEMRRALAGELDWVLAKALAKEPERRYVSARVFADDLQRYLDDKPVLARPDSVAYRARKFVRRNRSLVAATLVVIASLSLGLFFSLRENRRARAAEDAASYEARRANQSAEELAQANLELSRKSAEAVAAAARERERADEVMRLSALQDHADLVAEADALWPVDPSLEQAYVDWIERAQRLVEDLPLHRARQAELRAQALPRSAQQRRDEERSHPDWPRLQDLGPRIEAVAVELGETLDAERAALLEAQLIALEEEQVTLEQRVGARREWHFPDELAHARWWNNQVSQLVSALESLSDPSTGLLSRAPDAVSADAGWSVPRRLAVAQALEADFKPGSEALARWQAARAGLAGAYPGLDLEPQLGLIPLGADPESGLWEFWHVLSGKEPRRGSSGELAFAPDSGLVLVLLPGGEFAMGAQPSDPDASNYDPDADADEGPVHPVTLSPFFLSKYELTQGQWLRATGGNPAYNRPDNSAASLAHPIEDVTWLECRAVLERWGLSLPSEAQWEYGARAGTDTPWWPGPDRAALAEARAANLADQAAARQNAPWAAILDWPEYDDGFAIHARVGSLAPNAFGLHEVHGNVWEWCLDAYDGRAYRRGPARDPLQPPESGPTRSARSGSFQGTADVSRSASRLDGPPTLRDAGLGTRAARAVER